MDASEELMDAFYTLMGKQLKYQFQVAVKTLMNVFPLSFKFETKPENPKKPKTQIFLKSGSD